MQTQLDPESIQELARQIAIRMDPEALWDASDVGAHLKCSARYVLEHYAITKGFPKKICLTGVGVRKSQPKWKKQHVIDWCNSHVDGQTKRGGRPRQNDIN